MRTGWLLDSLGKQCSIDLGQLVVMEVTAVVKEDSAVFHGRVAKRCCGGARQGSRP